MRSTAPLDPIDLQRGDLVKAMYLWGVRGWDAGTVRSLFRVQEADPDGGEVLSVLGVDL
jgi:hypothetical protein